MSHILEYDLDGDNWKKLSYDQIMEILPRAINSINEVLKSGKSQREIILNSSDSYEKKDEDLIDLMDRIYTEIDKLVSIELLRPNSDFSGIYDFYLEFMNGTVNCLQEDIKKIPALMKFCSLYYSHDFQNSGLCSMVCEFKRDEDKINVYEKYIKGKHNYYHSMFSRIILSFKSPEMQIKYLEGQFVYICQWASLKLTELEKMEDGLNGSAREYWISLYEKYKDKYPVCQEFFSRRCVTASTVGKIGTTGLKAGLIEKAGTELKGALRTTAVSVQNYE